VNTSVPAPPAPSSTAPHGGPDGNERLTGSTGAMLIALLGVEALTVLSLDSLLSLHVFIGVLLIPPVLLKLASTGYRFTRYYSGSEPYVEKGPPPLLLRALGPLLVLSVGMLLATGVALLVIGPGDSPVRGLHKLSFIVLSIVISVHVLAHLRKVPRLAAADWRRRTRLPGSSIRRFVLLVSLLAGLTFGAVALHYDGAWVHRAHHHRFDDGGH
jgi:hypothetical protein